MCQKCMTLASFGDVRLNISETKDKYSYLDAV